MKLTRKQIIIVATVLLAAAVTVALVCLLTGDREPKTGSIEAAPYTCLWEKTNRHTLTLTFGGELPENPRWSIISNSGVIEATQLENMPAFEVKALAEGTGYLTVCMREEGFPVEKGADLDFSFSVDEKKSISIALSTVKIIEADAMETESGARVYCRRGQTGAFFVYITGTEWYVESCEGVDYTGPTADGDAVRLEITNRAEVPQGRLVIIENNSDRGIALSFTYKNGRLELIDCCDTTAAEPAPEEIDPEYQAMLEAVEKAETDEEKDKIRARYWLNMPLTTPEEESSAKKSD